MPMAKYLAAAALALAATAWAETPVKLDNETYVAPLSMEAALAGESLNGPADILVRVYADGLNPRVLDDALGRFAGFYRQFNVEIKFEHCYEPLGIEYAEDGVDSFNVNILPNAEYELFDEKICKMRDEYRGDGVEHISIPGDASGYAQFRTIIINRDHNTGEILEFFSDAGDENVQAAFLANTLTHEFGHVAGLSHVGPTHFKIFYNGTLPNFMSYGFDYDRAIGEFPVSYTNTQAAQVLSYLKGGVAYREMRDSCFDIGALEKRTKTK